MAKSRAKVPVKKGETKAVDRPSAIEPWRPIEALRREVDRLFEEFGRGPWPTSFGRALFDSEPLWQGRLGWRSAPAVDIVERDNAYQVTAELPGLDEKDVEVSVEDGSLTIRGEKREEKEEKKKGYHLQERRYGSFERTLRLPEGVDPEKIDARFSKGVLTVTLPKQAGVQKRAKKIDIKRE